LTVTKRIPLAINTHQRMFIFIFSLWLNEISCGWRSSNRQSASCWTNEACQHFSIHYQSTKSFFSLISSKKGGTNYTIFYLKKERRFLSFSSFLPLSLSLFLKSLNQMCRTRLKIVS
jgi:hypothetical protein